MKNKFLNQSAVKLLAKSLGKRLNADALSFINYRVELAVRTGCGIHNGGRVTVDATLLRYAVDPKTTLDVHQSR